MPHVADALQQVNGFLPINILSAAADGKIYYFLSATLENALSVKSTIYVLDATTTTEDGAPAFTELTVTGDIPTTLGATCVSAFSVFK